MTLTRRQVLDLLAQHQIRLSRALGQNFVVDPNTVRRIARLADVGAGDRVVEIGAGLGTLTLALAETGAAVTAVEIDRHVVPALRSVVEPAGVRVIEADAMGIDWGDFLDGDRWVLVANLPYNIATPLVATILDDAPTVLRLVVMVQREVADRLAAGPGDDAYGAVSVKVAYWATASIAAHVPRTVFVPQPNVDSAVVHIARRPEPAVVDVDRSWLFELVRTGFAQRRKMLRGTVGRLVPPDAFECAGVRPDARPEELDVAAWGRLARCSSGSEVSPS